MIDSISQTIVARIRRWDPTFLTGPRWRASTWWPTDGLGAMQSSLVRILSAAHAERLEVTPLVANLAEEHRGSCRRRLRRLARRLAQGTPLIDALEQTPEVLPDEDVLSIRFASQTGTLDATYRDLVQQHDLRSSWVQGSLRQTLYYMAVTMAILVLALSFLFVFIVPTLESMIEDFGLDYSSPELWQLHTLVGWGKHLSNHWPAWLLGVCGIAFLVGSSWSRRIGRRSIATRWLKNVAQARSAELLRLLSFAVEAGRPLPASLSTLARYHFDKNTRQSLLVARNEVEQGADVWNSLAQARLLTASESHALANSSSNQSRAWAMRQLANWKRDQVSRRAESKIALVRPMMTLVFATIVLLAGSAIVGFLTNLIYLLA